MIRTINMHCDLQDGVPWGPAIARLTTWAYTGYNVVDIYNDGRGGDLVAHYSNTDCDSKYTIGAILDVETGLYSFHS